MYFDAKIGKFMRAKRVLLQQKSPCKTGALAKLLNL